MNEKVKSEQTINQANLKSHYWLKIELIDFCKQHGLSTLGLKQDLERRIEIFFSSGCKIKPVVNKKTGKRDSHRSMTRETLVVNYNNDLATRQFFVAHIGAHFHFNAYLRQFTNSNNIIKGMTYGDLIDGWLAEELRRDNPDYRAPIGDQFKYNQFMRDFFANEKRKMRADAIKAWKIAKTLSGPKTYANYKKTQIKC